MNLERLKAFYRVARVKNFTKAAEVYYVTPGALSKAVKALEEELQVQLFSRNNNTLQLTVEGERLFTAAARILKESTLATDQLKSLVDENTGNIDIYSTQGFSSMYLSKYIHEFLNQYPDIKLSVKSLTNLKQSEFLSNGIAIHPYIKGLQGYEQIFLTSFTFKLYASKSYLKKNGVPRSLDDLDHHRLIAYSLDKSYSYFDMNWHLKRGKAEGVKRPYCIEVDSTFGRCRLAANDVGIISVPKEHPEVKTFDLIEVLPEIDAPAYVYYIIIDKLLKGYARNNSLINFMLSKHGC